jgi:hypothetical protein
MGELQLDDVRVVKLVTGDTIIGFQELATNELHETPELDNYIIVRYAHQVECDPVEDDNGELSFKINCFRWMPYIQDDALIIQKRNIIAIGMPDDNLLGCFTDLLQMSMFGFEGEGQEN